MLKSLPISTKNAVEDSKVIKVLKKWINNEQSSNSSQTDSGEEVEKGVEEKGIEKVRGGDTAWEK